MTADSTRHHTNQTTPDTPLHVFTFRHRYEGPLSCVSISLLLLLLLLSPSGLARRSRAALEGPVCGRQGRDCRCAPHVLHVGADGAQ